MGASGTQPAIRIQCESCRAVVATSHAWDAVACACGSVTVSGRPWRPSVHWHARPGGGWKVVEPSVQADDDGVLEEGGEHAGGTDERPGESRPIGY